MLTLPSVGAESVLLRHFSPVPARPGSAFNHVLYVMHRCAPINVGEADAWGVSSLGEGGRVCERVSV